MLVARSAAALGLLVVLGGNVGGCGQTGGSGPGTTVTTQGVDASDDASFFDDVNTACLTFCPRTPATLNLSCPSVVTSVLTTGNCNASRCLAKDGGLCAQAQVSIEPTQTGICHADLTLAGGFQYSTDVTFVQATSESSCSCTSIGPTQSTFMVNNPSTTCADARADAGALDAGTDAPADAPSEAAVDAASDAGSCQDAVPCGCSCPSGGDGGVCVCQNFSIPACPSNANTAASCSYAGSCMGCQENAGFECVCPDAGVSGADGGGPQWTCIGTGYACTGGTP